LILFIFLYISVCLFHLPYSTLVLFTPVILFSVCFSFIFSYFFLCIGYASVLFSLNILLVLFLSYLIFVLQFFTFCSPCSYFILLFPFVYNIYLHLCLWSSFAPAMQCTTSTRTQRHHLSVQFPGRSDVSVIAQWNRRAVYLGQFSCVRHK
jgi:hypothetical protein